jgi:hypothetical protein
MKALTFSERRVAFGVTALLLLALLVPSMAQPETYHHFADARTLFGVPRALDSLSNIGFLSLGLYGLWQALTGKLAFFSSSLKASVMVFFVGMVATSAGSTFYHLHPNNPGLVIDRLGMVVVFAGVLGMAGSHRISERAGWALTTLGLVAGPLSLAWWVNSGSISPYGVMQFGGIALACAMMWAAPRGQGPAWFGLLISYGLAKLFETFDVAVFEATQHLVSGHTIKHLLAALPVLAVTQGLRKNKMRK